ncbi:hypothetical protein NDU88_000781, partial [Pleurodeles waltl]
RSSQSFWEGGMSLELAFGLESSFTMPKSSLQSWALLLMRSVKWARLAMRIRWWCSRLAFLRAARLSGVRSWIHFFLSFWQMLLEVVRSSVNQAGFFLSLDG